MNFKGDLCMQWRILQVTLLGFDDKGQGIFEILHCANTSDVNPQQRSSTHISGIIMAKWGRF